MTKIILYGMCCVLLSTMYGCASIVNGTNQPLTVETRAQGQPISGANCKLVNDKGTWYVTTPGSVVIHRSAADLSLSCEKEGALPGVASVKSSTKAMAFGNILFGGVIGAGVDIATGSAFDYPSLVRVEMGSTTVITSPPPAGAATAPSAATVALVKSNAPAPGSKPPPQLESQQSYPHTLSGTEVTLHFQRYQELEMEQATVPFTLKIHADGRVERDCPTCNVHYGTGTMEIKQAESLVCFNWYVVTYPASGCYQVLQLGQNAFSLNAPIEHKTYRYMVLR